MTTAARLREIAAQLLAEADALDRPPAALTIDDEGDDWIETWEAARRHDLPIDTIRWLCREKGMGEKRAGRWMVSASALRRYISDPRNARNASG